MSAEHLPSFIRLKKPAGARRKMPVLLIAGALAGVAVYAKLQANVDEARAVSAAAEATAVQTGLRLVDSTPLMHDGCRADFMVTGKNRLPLLLQVEMQHGQGATVNQYQPTPQPAPPLPLDVVIGLRDTFRDNLRAHHLPCAEYPARPAIMLSPNRLRV